MFDEFLGKTTQLRSRDEPFVVATVVRFEAPVSGKPGDKAIIRSDGKIWGWIGGGCAQPAVIREALKALQDGRPRLVRIHPSANPDSEDGVVDYTMTCHSGGSLDIFIEPVLPKPHVIIFGRSAVAQTLAKLAKAMSYAVSAIAPGGTTDHFPDADAILDEVSLRNIKITPRTFVVVATQGEHDEEALTEALRSHAAYIAFVASEKKARKIFESLTERGVPADRISRIKAPAGLEIGAVSPEEIAASVLAEIVQKGRGPMPTEEAAQHVAEEIDPVCGMTVDPTHALHRSEYQGRSIFFCCAGCKRKFDRDPAQFSVQAAPAI
jgi:xanthine dehydrogenase accessory factor